jgi:hypothetical protein
MNENIAISIKQTLESLEADENMVVLLAVESGRRAWGFDSTAADRTTVFRLSS